MKRSELIVSAILVPIDFLMLVLAGVAAYYIRYSEFYKAAIRPVVFSLPFSEYLDIVLAVALAWLVIFALSGLYIIGGVSTKLKEFSKIFMACSTGILAIFIYIFFGRELFASRFIVLAAWILSIIFVTTGRMIVRFVQRLLFRFRVGLHRVVIIGNGKTGANIVDEFKNKVKLGYDVVRHFDNYNDEVKKQIEKFNEQEPIDEIIQADSFMAKEKVLDLRDFAFEHAMSFRFVPDLIGAQATNIEVGTAAGVPIVELKRTKLEGWGRIIKRIFDVIISGAIIMAASPIMLVMAGAIKLDSRGPVFFGHDDDGKKMMRVGQGGRLFHYFKFRSMKHKTHSLRYSEELQKRNVRQNGPLVKIENDPRITRVGKFLRRYSLDELAEFILVFIGEMSLVGPRPHFPEEVAKYEKHHRKVLILKPGITGLAQVSGRSDLDFNEEVKLDTYYIENWSIWLDWQILLKTPIAVLKGRKTL